MSRPTIMTIDLQALQHNFKRVQEYAPKKAVIAMVKANAYGHGIVPITQALPMADAFGVASLEEGLTLRQAGIQQPIVLMEGLFHEDEIPEAAKYHFTLVIHHQLHVDMLNKVRVEKPFPVWLKINTGMFRLGVDYQQVNYFYQQLLTCENVQKPIGMMTHFAEADAQDLTAMNKQIMTFRSVVAAYDCPLSLANSAAILRKPETHGDWIRPGLLLYGASPFAGNTATDHGLKPVMTFSSKLIAITQVQPGDKVGYGGEWMAKTAMRIGVVGVGYGDGYPQFAKNGTPVLVNNKRCQLAGRVSMDMLTVDLRQCPEAQIGDKVILWGEGLPVEEVACHAKTSPYELLTRMTPRPKLQIRP